MKKLTKVGAIFTLGLFALGFFFINKAEAQEGCGVIVAPNYFFDYPNPLSNRDLNTRNIENCENPFNEDSVPASPYTLRVEGEEVISGGSVTVPVGGTNQIEIVGEPHLSDKANFLFKHVDGDLVFVEHKAPEMDLPDYLDYIDVYFSNPSDRELYRDVTIGQFSGGGADSLIYDEETGDYLLDSEGREILFRYYEFLESADANFQKPAPKITAGTYTMVTKEMLLILISSESAWDKFREFLIPTAHAEDLPAQLTYTITFTIVEGVEEIKPSVLFLPGIMGSNLYEESDECNLFGGVDEVKRWVSTFDCDVERLVMDENGVSINNLYTKTEDGVVEDVFLVSNLYDSFIEELEELKDEDKIADYRAVPYDWRLRLGDILKTVNIGGRITPDPEADYQDGYVYKSLKALVDASPNRKVVLVGHSNGGLVIKTLLATMKAENDPLLDSIEKVVLVAVPQAGTPEAVVGMLHGVEIGKGFAVSLEQSRQLINTAPFGYHLLPSEDYFEMVETPVITIESGTSTDAWRGQFGAEIDTLIELKYFLEKESGRPTPAWEDTKTPATAYSGLINYANSAHGFMQDWKPEQTQVYEVAGTGIETPATISYFSDYTCFKSEVRTGGVTHCIERGTKLGYRINKVVDGDGTVVVPSATLDTSSKKYWINLDDHNSIFRNNRDHKDVFEVPGVVGLLQDFITGEVQDHDFVTEVYPNFSNEKRIVLQLHSPLDLCVILSDGEVVGSSTPSQRGVQYYRYGEVQYLSIPESETDYEIRLDGLATGSFTLDIEEYEGSSILERSTYSAVPSSTSTKVSLKVEEGEEAVLEIDYQGDGIYEAIALPGLAAIEAVPAPATTTPALLEEEKSSSSGTKVGAKNLLLAPTGELSGAEVITNERDLLLILLQLLTQYRDLLMKAKVQ